MALNESSRMSNRTVGTADTALLPRGLNPIDWIALALMIVGGLNWGLVGAMNFDLVAAIFGSMTTASRAVYVLVGLAALYGIVMAIRLSTRSNAQV